jgi:NhaP-type Na+/H+ and K+/H+ antiporter
MKELEVLIGLVLAATVLAAVARRVGAPYPVFLALGGAILAFVPGAPSFSVLPELALALFVAPVLLDAAYDASPRDLRDNWAPVTGLVVVAVGLTTLAVALVARALMPAMPWAPAIALGAIVAPPDAAAATAVLPGMAAATVFAFSSEVAAMRTSWPAAVNCLASAEPMLPAPRMRMFMGTSGVGRWRGASGAPECPGRRVGRG